MVYSIEDGLVYIVLYTYIVLDNIPDYSQDNLTEKEVRTLPDIRQLFWRTSGELLISNL